MKQIRKEKSSVPKEDFDLTQFDFLYDHILVKSLSKKSVSGLVNPDTYEDKPEFGKVIKIGKGRMLDNGTIVPMDIKIGDVIFFGKYSTEQTRNLGSDFHIIRLEDVKAILRK